jgi:catechol 2,3-dioxygenase-like lactoylglutathione lyase family enzyme
MNISPRLLRRCEILALFCATLAVLAVHVVRAGGQRPERLFDVVLLDHINIRATNPTRSAHFYQSLFGGDLLWTESIPPNPSSPAAESWYLELGQQYLSISPTFPERNLPVGLDHVSPAVHGYTAAAATATAKDHGIEMVSGTGGWLRDPDGMIYQLRNDAGVSKPAVPPAQAKPKVGDQSATGPAPFAAVAIREITLRVADLNKTGDFWTSVFGGETTPAGTRDARTFRFGETVVRLIPRAASDASARVGPGGPVGMDRLAIAVKDFSAASAERALRQRGIEPNDGGRPGEVHFVDPDGIHVQLVAAVSAR